MHRRADRVEGLPCGLDKDDSAVVEIATSCRTGRETAIDVASGHDARPQDAFDFGSDVEGHIDPFASNTASSHGPTTAQPVATLAVGIKPTRARTVGAITAECDFRRPRPAHDFVDVIARVRAAIGRVQRARTVDVLIGLLDVFVGSLRDDRTMDGARLPFIHGRQTSDPN